MTLRNNPTYYLINANKLLLRLFSEVQSTTNDHLSPTSSPPASVPHPPSRIASSAPAAISSRRPGGGAVRRDLAGGPPRPSTPGAGRSCAAHPSLPQQAQAPRCPSPSALGLPLHSAHLPSAGGGRAFREVNAGVGTGAAGAVGAVGGGPSATSVLELLECPVCTCSMFPPIHQMGYAKLMASNASTLNNQISSQACKNFFIMYPSPIWISSKPWM
ncbi:uncharacterized protein LOC101770236 [Setaria italica]|nr:uncharacterized protein LOC101770236 [Setaria italica]